MKTRDDTIIVTKNLEQIKWLNQHGIFGKVKDHITPKEAAGKHIVGAVPYVIAVEARDVTVINCRPLGNIKSKDMSSEQLETQNAELKTYRIIPV